MKTARLTRVMERLHSMGMGQLLVSDPDSLYYLLGHSYDPGERLLALYLNEDGKAVLFHNRMFHFPEQPGLSIAYYDDSQDYMALVSDTVKPGVIGVDKFLRAKFLVPLLEKRSDLQVKLGSAAVDWARKYKDAEELERMRRASRINDQTVEEAIRHIGDGWTEREMADFVCDTHIRLGADARMDQLVCFGVNTAEPHHASDRTRLNPGEAVIFDIYAPVGHYFCDMTRTVFWKDVTEEQRRVYEIVKDANAAGVAAIRPGIPLREVDRAAREVIEQAGYGAYFTHRTGHGIGLALHEPPDVSSVTDEVIEPGMVFSVEPGIYLPGKFGVRVEDLVAVTEEGAERLNHYNRELIVVD